MLFPPRSLRRLTPFMFVAIVFFLPAFSAAQTTYSNIDQMSGWESCTVCAGVNGQGDAAQYSLTRGISSPSMDGKSAKFSLGGTNSYTAAIWWRQLGGNKYARHFKYDLYFYMKNPGASQALEFDVNQSVGGKKFIFGTECAFKSGVWRTWNYSTRWQSTGIACKVPTAYKWHHLIEEFERTTGGNVKFVSITLDGVKHYINKIYAPKSANASEINVAFQMDGDKYQTDYSVYLDKVKLTYW